MSGRGFVGRLESGARVYVYRSRNDQSDAPLAFAVFADTGRDGKMRIVARFHDPSQDADASPARQMYCANGHEHKPYSCHWTRVPEQLSPREHARWSAHWWTHVGNTRAEVVELKPAGERGANLKRQQSR